MAPLASPLSLSRSVNVLARALSALAQRLLDDCGWHAAAQELGDDSRCRSSVVYEQLAPRFAVELSGIPRLPEPVFQLVIPRKKSPAVVAAAETGNGNRAQHGEGRGDVGIDDGLYIG